MERSTKKIKTPGGYEIEMRDYITGREYRLIQSVFLSGMEVRVGVEGTPEMNNAMKPEMIDLAQDKTIEILIVSVNGNKENVLQSVLDMPKDDFDQVVAAMNEVSNGLGKKK